MASGRLGPTTSSSGNLSTLFHFQLNFARPSILRPFGFVTGCRFGFRDWPTAVVVPTVVTPTVHSGQTWVHFTRFGSGPASIRVSSFGQLSWFESRFSRSRTKDRPEILLILFGLAEVNCNHRSLSTSPELCQTTRSEAEFTTELESTSFRLIDVILLDSSNLYPCVFEEIANATNVDDDEMKTDSKDA
ncbi:hypothetical protein HanXRQr2_Chr07g0307771 [Helianthus annuus]|uniref:Uncharacterized protein n=1 Tax=Helianthus annuus TaxID=4232 RepID=A0A9K3NGM4_HELAN|nr:hypothetical protein HanXRQr2_Chr07g0307761 [Helianthus annuus]KAF5799718.1 hypothetical protein HanXRQr2_Chr07g0307771 [Helianthus annuus]